MKLAYRIALCTCLAAPAYAGVSNLSSPEIKPGILEAEYKGTRYGDDSSSKNNAQYHQFEFDYGVSDRLKLGTVFDAGRTPPGGGTSMYAVGVQAQYQFTDQKHDWWLSSAVKTEYALATDSGGHDVAEIKFLVARNEGDARVVANLNLGRDVGENRGHGIAVESKLKALYKVTKAMGPGLEWHGEWGNLDNASFDGGSNEHYAGPILTGTLLELEEGGYVSYTAGYYWGLTGASADNAARLQLQYGLAF